MPQFHEALVPDQRRGVQQALEPLAVHLRFLVDPAQAIRVQQLAAAYRPAKETSGSRRPQVCSRNAFEHDGHCRLDGIRRRLVCSDHHAIHVRGGSCLAPSQGAGRGYAGERIERCSLSVQQVAQGAYSLGAPSGTGPQRRWQRNGTCQRARHRRINVLHATGMTLFDITDRGYTWQRGS